MKRHNFYKGELVTPTEMNNLQNYTDKITEAVVSRAALGNGIINGFEVSKANDLNLSVGAGTAYNANGEFLNLEDPVVLSINDFIPTIGLKKILIAMKKDYIETDPVQDTIGNIINTTWTPTVSFEISEFDQGIPNNFFELAIITLNSQGIVEIEQTSKPVPFKVSRESLYWNGQSIVDIMYPKGYQYTQYPNDLGIFEPTEEPSTLFGGVWELLHSDKSVFFRTEGDLANADRTEEGMQGDAVIKMTGVVGEVTNWETKASGVFKTTKTIGNRTNSGGAAVFATAFDNSLQVPTSTENRSINMLMRIWKRIA